MIAFYFPSRFSNENDRSHVSRGPRQTMERNQRIATFRDCTEATVSLIAALESQKCERIQRSFRAIRLLFPDDPGFHDKYYAPERIPEESRTVLFLSPFPYQ